MEKAQKERICNFLYKDEETRKFLCNDLFQEFSQIIKDRECIHWKNIVSSVREKNKAMVTTKILLFITENKDYYNKLDEIYSNMLINDVVKMLLLGYVFYLSQTNEQFKQINIFKNKKSICYSSMPTIFDVVQNLT